MPEINLIKIDGKPLEKLIDVISKGIGTLYRPRAIRKDAESKAYEIEIIERAKSKALAEGKEIDADANDRIQERLLHNEIKRQQNIDNVSEIAAEQLSQEEKVSNEPVAEDWATRFFNIVKDVSDEEMQNLWGRILAEEVKQPKSFSFRTLELLKNLSKEEAEIFTKFAQIALNSSDKYFVYDPDKGKFLEENLNIHFTDRLVLVDVGLVIGENNLEFSFKPVAENEEISGLFYRQKGFFITRKNETPRQAIQIIIFSKPGIELLKLVPPLYNESYIEKIAVAFKHETTVVKFGDVVRDQNGQMDMFNEKEF